tara:strand:- start:594 stop:1046 length:453 start_codon:yes stop_codon:yes gene_type:complete
MSNLLVQNIKHTNNTTSMAIDTSGQVSIRGEGSATTTNLQQGLNKAWCTVNQESGISTLDSFNQSSIADVRTGETLNTFTTNMGNNDYAIVHSEYDTDGNWSATGGMAGAKAVSGWNVPITTSAFSIVRYTSGSGGQDSEYCAMVSGDLA